MIFVIDNSVYKKDSNYKLYDTLDKYHVKFLIIKTIQQLIDYMKLCKPTYFILSGSPLMFSRTDMIQFKEQFELNKFILDSFIGNVPILGICFGAQFIISYFRGQLYKLEEKFCGFWDNTKLYFCLNYLIHKLPNGFKTIMKLGNFGTIMFLSMENNIYGVMFHPEKHEDTTFIIKEFLNIMKTP